MLKKTQTHTAAGKPLRTTGFLLCAICLILFLLPMLVAGIVNIGNVTGVLVSLILMGYILFTKPIHAFILVQWNKDEGKTYHFCQKSAPSTPAGSGLPWRRVTLLGTGFFALLIASLVVIETACMIGACTKAPTENATAIVLGCRVYGERASLSLVERLEAAYDYLSENPEATCVVSGGQGPGENISEAECMYRWLTDKGIDGSRIFKEEKSTSTDENIRFSKEVIEANGLNKNVALISNEYHIYRATLIASDNDLSYGTKPATTAFWLFPSYYVRELYGILAEWLF